MKLSDWAKCQGISYQTAYRWFKAGKLPIKAYQSDSGTIIVSTEEENMLSRVTNGSNRLGGLFPDVASMLDLMDAFAPTYWNKTIKQPQNRFKTLNKDDKYIVVGEIPGFGPNEIKISVKDNMIQISGAHEIRDGDENNYFSKETSTFNVMYTLPNDVNSDGISANHENGVLEITIPKSKNSNTLKEIPIKSLKE